MKASTAVYWAGIIMYVYAITSTAIDPTPFNQVLCIVGVSLAGILLVLAVQLDKKRL